MSAKEDNVRVVVRCRPLLPDLEQNEENIIKIGKDQQTIQIAQRQFTFDRVFGPDSDGDEVYNKSAKHIVDCVLQGYNGTIFAYGQTGTGKTFTTSKIMEQSFQHIFDHISKSKNNNKFLVRASYYEIYNEEIRDLLSKSTTPTTTPNLKEKMNFSSNNKNPRKILELKENPDGKIIIKDLSNFVVNNFNDLKKLKEAGDKHRHFGSTKMNQRSSRSHTIFTITIETEICFVKSNDDDNSDDPKLPPSSSASSSSSSIIRIGKFHLIDLAGSERQSKTGTIGLRLKEASKINLSLTSLSLVIASLTDPKATFIPYRNSKLTRILSDSLGGNSKTLLIACIGPAKMNLDETISTLRFASLTKHIKNKPIINEDQKDALLKRFEEQIRELKAQLEMEKDNDINNDNNNSNDMIDGNQPEQSQQQQKFIPQELIEKLKKLEEKICIGGENLLEKVEKQEKLIVQSELELQECRAKENQLKIELEKKQMEILFIEESYTSLQEELIALNRKIKKATNFLLESKSELDDQNYEFEKLRMDLLDSIRISEKEIKLTQKLINYFIPENFLKLIENNCNYNQHTGEWELRCLAYTGNNMKDEYDDTSDDDDNNDNDHQYYYYDDEDNYNYYYDDNNTNSKMAFPSKFINTDNIYLSYSNLNLS